MPAVSFYLKKEVLDAVRARASASNIPVSRIISRAVEELPEDRRDARGQEAGHGAHPPGARRPPAGKRSTGKGPPPMLTGIDTSYFYALAAGNRGRGGGLGEPGAAHFRALLLRTEKKTAERRPEGLADRPGGYRQGRRSGARDRGRRPESGPDRPRHRHARLRRAHRQLLRRSRLRGDSHPGPPFPIIRKKGSENNPVVS